MLFKPQSPETETLREENIFIVNSRKNVNPIYYSEWEKVNNPLIPNHIAFFHKNIKASKYIFKD